jgi:Helix-turn-helix domain
MSRKTSSMPVPESVAPPTCDRLWSVQDVSAFLGVPVATLHQWRYLGTGPAVFRVGKHLRYDPDVVRRWLVDDCGGAA